MSDKSSNREAYEARIQEIKDSDMSMGERRRAIQAAQREHYDSGFEKWKDEVNHRDPTYTMVLVGGLFLAGSVIGATLAPSIPGGGSTVGGLVGVAIGVLLGTRTGLSLLDRVLDARE